MAKITLWDPPEERPAFRLLDLDGHILEEGPVLTADEVYCDLCNAEVVVRPVPVVYGHAACLRCLSRLEPKWVEKIPFEVLAVWKFQLDEQASA